MAIQPLKHIIIFIIISLFVISCHSGNTKPKTAKEHCKTKGGEWKMLTRGAMGCNVSYGDGQKKCDDGAQCQSNVCLWRKNTTNNTLHHCASTTIAVIHAGCTGGKVVNGQRIPLGCP